MRVVWGQAEKKMVYDGFELDNLNSDAIDPTHVAYQKYLETRSFIPPKATTPQSHYQPYWAHITSNRVPSPASTTTTETRGLFNVFPLDLVSDVLDKAPPSSSIGTSSSSSFFFTPFFFSFLFFRRDCYQPAESGA